MSVIVVRDVEGDEVGVFGGLLLQEKTNYFVEAPGALAMRLGGRALHQSREGWALSVEFWTGRTELVVEYPGQTLAHAVQVLPDPRKVSEMAWENILADLEEMIPGLSLGAQGGQTGSVAAQGVSLPLLTQALLPLLPQLLRSVRAIVAAPRLHAVDERDEIPLYRTRRVEREFIPWLARQPGASGDPDILRDTVRSRAVVPVHETHDVLQHPANCYVAWLAWRVTRALHECASRWNCRSVGNDEEREWCRARSSACQSAAGRLEALVHGSFLKHVPRRPASDAALLVAIDDPRYARFQRQARRFLNPLFDPTNQELPGAPIRPTFDIYELWCFLTIARALAGRFPGAGMRTSNLSHLLSGTGSGAKYVFDLASGRQVKLEFNPTFASNWTRSPDGRRFSISGQRRPDVVVSAIGGGGPPVWVPLDAKYRVNRGAIADSFESIHIYRDALRDVERGGACTHAALLAPSMTPQSAPWFDPKFSAEFHCGVFELVPGGPGLGRLIEWLSECLNLG